MYYKEMLRNFDATGLSIYKVVVASEVDYYLGNRLNEDQFETICDFVYDWIQSSEAKAEEVVIRIKNLIDDGDFSLEDFDELSYDRERELTYAINRMF